VVDVVPVAAVVGDSMGDAVEVELVAEVEVAVLVLALLPVELALMVCPAALRSDHWVL